MPRMIRRCAGAVFAVCVAVLLCCPTPARAQDEKVWRYKPSQTNPPIPKFDYTETGRPIMEKRHPQYPNAGFPNYTRYRFAANKRGVEHFTKGCKLKREPDEILTEQQREILREWGQPDYLRGPYQSERNDSVIEWAYHRQNHIFQFVDREMVYEGPLTDADRTLITYGAPRNVQVFLAEPNIRRETFIYEPTFLAGHEMIFSFSNGKLVTQQKVFN